MNQGSLRVAARRLIVLLPLLTASAGCSPAPDPMQTIRDHHFYAALTSYNDGRYDEALASWRRAAEFGDGEAARNLGHMYRQGLGVEADLPIALAWYQVAADAGVVSAQYNLGMVYLGGGPGVPKDRLAALHWLNAAAAAGVLPARWQLDRMAAEDAPAVPATLAVGPTRAAAEALAAAAPSPAAPPDPPPAPPPAPQAAPSDIGQEPARAQVGSFRTQAAAEAEAKRLRRPGITWRIIANRDRGQGRWYRLMAVGGASAVDSLCRSAGERGSGCWGWKPAAK